MSRDKRKLRWRGKLNILTVEPQEGLVEFTLMIPIGSFGNEARFL